MQFYKYLYVQEKLKKKEERILQGLRDGKLMPTIYLITLASSEKNQLDILPSALLLQPSYPKEALFVVGITKGRDAALQYVEDLMTEALQETGEPDLRKFILKKEEEACTSS